MSKYSCTSYVALIDKSKYKPVLKMVLEKEFKNKKIIIGRNYLPKKLSYNMSDRNLNTVELLNIPDF